MDVKVWMYLVYPAIGIGLTVWVTRLPMAPPIPAPGQAGGPPAVPA